MDYRLVEYTSDKGIISENKETKYYYQKYFEDKDYNTEVKGILNTTFSEFTISTFSKTIEVYTRSYKKAPQLLAEIGGVANSLYIMVLFLNSFVEKRLKEAEIFNLCCSDRKVEKNKSNRKDSDTIKMDDVKINLGVMKNNINQDNSKSNGEKSSLELGLNKEKGNNDESNRELNKNNEMQNEDGSNKSVVRFKSIIFHKDVSVNMLIDVDYGIIEILCPCRRRALHTEKMSVAEKFCDELFDVHFLFANVLDSQINFNNIFDKI